MSLLSVLLESDSARREVAGNRLRMLEGLRRQMAEIAEDISQSGLTMWEADTPLPLEQLEQLREELDGLTGLEPLD